MTDTHGDGNQQKTALNTDRELWRERDGDYYADSIHVTERGGIGINCGGHVVVMPLRKWHALAVDASSAAPIPSVQNVGCHDGVHEWTNQFGDDWTPDVGMTCDCREKQWGVDGPTFEWRLARVKIGTPGGHGSWVETNHPAVVACMGSVPECAANGCQARIIRRDHDEAYGYLSRLFVHLAPQCTPLPTLRGLCTQIDNYIAGLRRDAADPALRALSALREIERLRLATDEGSLRERADRIWEIARKSAADLDAVLSARAKTDPV